MTGYVSILGECYVCRRMFSSNPDWVPSLRLPNGGQAIFCEACMAKINAKRQALGFDPFVVHPLAYEASEA